MVNLETCGARLEVVFLGDRHPVQGAYGGFFIVVDNVSIRAGRTQGMMVLLFAPQARKAVDRLTAAGAAANVN